MIDLDNTEGPAKLFDGKTSKPLLVKISLFGDRIEILSQQPQEHLFWFYSDLVVLEKPHHDKPGVLSLTTEPDARLIVDNIPLFNEILKEAHHKNIKVATIHHGWRKLIGACLLTLLLILLIVWAWPRIATTMAYWIPYKWDNALGHYAIKQISHHQPECVDKPGKMALNKLTQKLIANAESEEPFDFYVIDDQDMINAFTVPGANIITFHGLLKFAKTPDELADILAHEMGHAILHHPTEGMIRNLGIYATLAIIMGSGQSTNIANTFITMKHSREAERQADEIAVKILTQANISTQGMVDFFEKMLKFDTKSKIIQHFQSHPASKERIQNIKTLSQPQKTTPSLTALLNLIKPDHA